MYRADYCLKHFKLVTCWISVVGRIAAANFASIANLGGRKNDYTKP